MGNGYLECVYMGLLTLVEIGESLLIHLGGGRGGSTQNILEPTVVKQSNKIIHHALFILVAGEVAAPRTYWNLQW